jgi:hypothetical protein
MWLSPERSRPSMQKYLPSLLSLALRIALNVVAILGLLMVIGTAVVFWTM